MFCLFSLHCFSIIFNNNIQSLNGHSYMSKPYMDNFVIIGVNSRYEILIEYVCYFFGLSPDNDYSSEMHNNT